MTPGLRAPHSGAVEHLMTDGVVHPVQFQGIWHRSRARSAEQRLALAVLQQAVLDLQKYRYAGRRRRQRLYMETYVWVASHDERWPYSFINLCHALHLDPDLLRIQLLAGDPPSAMREAA